VLIPLGWLPWDGALLLGMLLLASAPFLALRVMGVRDWRCYLITYGTFPVVSSIGLGTISTALMLALALIWRERGTVEAGISALVAKLFLWPLVITLAALGGCRRAVFIAIGACVGAVGSWAIIGFADLAAYPRLLSDLSAIEAHNSFSTTGIAYALGLPLELGTGLALVLGGLAAALSVREARSRHRDAARSYGLLATLLLSPIVWMHYLALLPVAIAARYPRFGPIWLVPLALWAHQRQSAAGSLFALSLFWGCVLTILAAVIRKDHGARSLSLTDRLGRAADRLARARPQAVAGPAPSRGA
jgi:hypothetical protein